MSDAEDIDKTSLYLLHDLLVKIEQNKNKKTLIQKLNVASQIYEYMTGMTDEFITKMKEKILDMIDS